MSGTAPALLIAAAGVGLGHAILPDHWLPLAVLGRTRRYPVRRVARLSGLAGVAHVLVSVLLGAVVIVVGLQLRSSIQSGEDAIVGAILIATGLAFAAMELTGHGHHHDHDHGHGHRHHHGDGHDHAGHGHDAGHSSHPVERKGLRGLAAVVVPFGAAASPDLTILPVFLAATAAGTATAIGSLIVFAGVTIGTIVTLTLLACFGGYQAKGEWLERWGNLLTALTLLVIGGLLAAGVI